MIYAQKGMFVRLVYLLVSLAIWLLRLGGRLAGSNRVILCYHGITASNAATFYRQMQMIAGRVVALDNNHLDEDRWFSRPPVALTFDDAFENLLANMMPVIEELQIPVSIYVVTSCMGECPCWLRGSGHYDEHETLMSANQIKVLANNPLISIGSHTCTHPRLTDIPRDEILAELSESKHILGSLIGREVRTLAFPYGAYNSEISKIASACGLTKLLTLEEQMVNSDQVNGEMGRFSMEPDVWPIEFRLTADGAYSWLYRFRRVIRVCRKVARS